MQQIILPSHAQLPRTVATLGDMCDLLDKALGPVKRFRRVREDLENDVRLAVGVHALNALDAAHAVRTLAATDHAGTISPHFRTIFESLVKIRWMRKEPQRARDYLNSEPFERYILATPKVKASDRWPKIVADCKTIVAQVPSLMKLPKATKSNGEPDFNAIGRALRMPKLRAIATDIGMDFEDYLIDFSVPSTVPHTSVIHTKNFAKELNSDGTVTLSTRMDPIMLTGYVARTATRTGEILQEALGVFPDGAILYEAEKVAERLSAVVTALKGVIPS